MQGTFRRVVDFAYWMPSLAWMALIWAGSSQPGSAVGLSDPIASLAHLLAFSVLTAFFSFSISKTTALALRQVLLSAVLFACLYAAVDELHQSFVPGRTASISDWMIDAAAALGVAVAAASLRLGRTLWDQT